MELDQDQDDPGKINMEPGKPSKYRGLQHPSQRQHFQQPATTASKGVKPRHYYDEVSSFAPPPQRDKEERRKLLGVGKLPKPPRSIKKVTIDEPPLKSYGEGGASESPKLLRKVRGLKSRGKSEEYNLMSKFDSTVFNPDSKLELATAKKLKASLSSTKRQSKPSTTSKKDILNLRSNNNVLDGIESDLVFGAAVTSPSVGRQLGRTSISNASQTPNAPETAMKIAKKKTAASVHAIKKKINSKKEEWRDEQFGWDGYHYKHESVKGILGSSSKVLENAPVPTLAPNEKLAQLSRRFRQSIDVNTDMKRSIRTPRDSASSVGESSKAEDDGRDESEKSAILNRQSALYVPMERKIPREKKPGKAKSAGIIAMQTLLNTQPLTSSLQDVSQNNEGRPFDPAFDSKTRNNNNEKDDAYPHQPWRPKTPEMITLSENFYKPPSSPSGRDTAGSSQDLIKERLGESARTVDEAATIASRLGSLMARVELCKKGEGGTRNNNNNSSSSSSSIDAVNLARELRELASSMEKDYGRIGAGGVRSNMSAGSVETQTEGRGPAAVRSSSRQNISQPADPKFTKQMSYTDQLVLRKLREVRQLWSDGVQELQNSQTGTV